MEHKMMEDCTGMMKDMAKMAKGGSHTGGGSHAGGVGGMGPMLGMASGGFLIKRLSGTFLGRPLALFSLGAAAGALLYKNRKGVSRIFEPATKEAVRAVTRTGDAGKDFIQEQKEKLSDIVAEVKEEEEEKAKQVAAAQEPPTGDAGEDETPGAE